MPHETRKLAVVVVGTSASGTKLAGAVRRLKNTSGFMFASIFVLVIVDYQGNYELRMIAVNKTN